jgi:putative membrane protein
MSRRAIPAHLHRRSWSPSRHHDNSCEDEHASADHVADVLGRPGASVDTVRNARARFGRLTGKRVFAVQTLNKESDAGDDEHEANDGFHTNNLGFGNARSLHQPGEFRNPAKATLSHGDSSGAQLDVKPHYRFSREPRLSPGHSLGMNINPALPLRSFRSRHVAAICFIGTLLSIPGLAQNAVRDDRVRDERVAPANRDRDVRAVDSARPLKRSDRNFMEKAARTSMSEVAISRVAASRTSNPEVRRFAQMMINDHEEAVEQLSAMAANRGVSLPAKDPRPERWEKRDAKNFDREYLEQMIDDHEDVVKLFANHAKEGEDADTVAYARKHLPKLQRHLQHAIDLKRALTDKRD